jgi:hypothetical protein
VEERPAERHEDGDGQEPRTSADTSTESSGWVTTDVAAAALGVSPRTVRRYIERGELTGRVEEGGITKAWLVSIASVQALRDRRGYVGRDRGETTELTAIADGLAEVLDRLSARLETRTAEAADARARLELTERAESTLREERDRIREELGAERVRREQAERERDELAARLAALEGARGSSQTAAAAEAKGAQDGAPGPATGGAQEGGEERRPSSSWWRRFFGFE